MTRPGVRADDGQPELSSLELLGIAPQARVLIVNLDDFGMYPAINTAVISAMEDGVASSCSLMVPCPGAAHAMSLLRRRPALPFGIHLTLFCDTVDRRWGPLTDREHVTSLLDTAGELFSPVNVPELLSHARIDEVEREFRAQINVVADAGLTPTHLDWHCLADGGRADIFELTAALAREYGLAMRIWLEPGQRWARQRGLPAVDHEFLDSSRLELDGKATRLAALLRDVPAGLSEWAVHPGLADAEAQRIDSGWRVRSTDFEFLMSPQTRDILQQEQIVVIDYRVMQHAWSRTP